jgi:hypothetical protein
VKEDLEYSILNIEPTINEKYCSFRFKRKQVEASTLKELAFGEEGLVYLGVDIITNKFKNTRPNRSTLNPFDIVQQMNQGQVKLSVALGSSIAIKEARFMVIQLEDGIGIRVDFNEVRDYKIKYLLGILKVPGYNRQGLMVLGKIYTPDEQV